MPELPKDAIRRIEARLDRHEADAMERRATLVRIERAIGDLTRRTTGSALQTCTVCGQARWTGEPPCGRENCPTEAQARGLRREFARVARAYADPAEPQAEEQP